MNVHLPNSDSHQQHPISTPLASPSRLYYLDHLKIALTCLVIAHHAGQPYGGSGGFWYYQVAQESEGLHLGRFFSVNASFFMSLFFLISAYFMPTSYDRKGAHAFLKDRLERLGVPIFIGFFIIVPILMYTYFINFRDYNESLSFFSYYINVYFGLGGQPDGWTGPSWPDMQFAHLWFLEHLLFYALIYTIVRKWLNPKQTYTTFQSPLTNLIILGFAIIVSLVTSLVRIQFPIDHWIGFLGFIQAEFYHVPQYASFFIVGILARRNNWLSTMSRSVGRTWLITGVVLAVTYYLGFVTFPTRSGITIGNLLYSFYETFMCTGLSIGLIYLFRSLGNAPSAFLNQLSNNAFTVYIIHVPVLVAIQYTLGKTALPLMWQFLLAILFGIIGSFLLSHFIIRKVPYFKKVL